MSEKFQDAFIVGIIKNNDVSRQSYAKALNKALLEKDICDCDCCTKCILCGENPRTLEEPMCEECNGDFKERMKKIE